MVDVTVISPSELDSSPTSQSVDQVVVERGGSLHRVAASDFKNNDVIVWDMASSVDVGYPSLTSKAEEFNSAAGVSYYTDPTIIDGNTIRQQKAAGDPPLGGAAIAGLGALPASGKVWIALQDQQVSLAGTATKILQLIVGNPLSGTYHGLEIDETGVVSSSDAGELITDLAAGDTLLLEIDIDNQTWQLNHKNGVTAATALGFDPAGADVVVAYMLVVDGVLESDSFVNDILVTGDESLFSNATPSAGYTGITSEIVVLPSEAYTGALLKVENGQKYQGTLYQTGSVVLVRDYASADVYKLSPQSLADVYEAINTVATSVAGIENKPDASLSQKPAIHDFLYMGVMDVVPQYDNKTTFYQNYVQSGTRRLIARWADGETSQDNVGVLQSLEYLHRYDTQDGDRGTMKYRFSVTMEPASPADLEKLIKITFGAGKDVFLSSTRGVLDDSESVLHADFASSVTGSGSVGSRTVWFVARVSKSDHFSPTIALTAVTPDGVGHRLSYSGGSLVTPTLSMEIVDVDGTTDDTMGVMINDPAATYVEPTGTDAVFWNGTPSIARPGQSVSESIYDDDDETLLYPVGSLVQFQGTSTNSYSFGGVTPYHGDIGLIVKDGINDSLEPEGSYSLVVFRHPHNVSRANLDTFIDIDTSDLNYSTKPVDASSLREFINTVAARSEVKATTYSQSLTLPTELHGGYVKVVGTLDFTLTLPVSGSGSEYDITQPTKVVSQSTGTVSIAAAAGINMYIEGNSTPVTEVTVDTGYTIVELHHISMTSVIIRGAVTEVV